MPPRLLPSAAVIWVACPPSLSPTAALTSGSTEAAADQLARAAEDVGAASAAAALAAAAGSTQSLVEAAVLAVQQGASAEALAQALSQASGGSVDPGLLRQGDASALAAVVDQNVRDSVEVIVRTSSRSLNAASSATATALAVALEDVCRGGNATAAAVAAAKATATATGEPGGHWMSRCGGQVGGNGMRTALCLPVVFVHAQPCACQAVPVVSCAPLHCLPPTLPHPCSHGHCGGRSHRTHHGTCIWLRICNGKQYRW